MLADLDVGRLEAYLSSIALKSYTTRTITHPVTLRQNLRKIREQGYAIDTGEHEADVKCIAAPVRGENGDLIAGISISGPVFRITQEKVEAEFINAVTETAKAISYRLGYLEEWFVRGDLEFSQRNTPIDRLSVSPLAIRSPSDDRNHYLLSQAHPLGLVGKGIPILNRSRCYEFPTREKEIIPC